MMRIFKSWWYSLLLLAGYLLVFHLMLAFPHRATFLMAGVVSVSLLAGALGQAAIWGYFVDRSDLVLHALVVADLAAECALFEPLRAASLCLFCAEADAAGFHNNYNFYGCATIFAVLVGGYHGRALSARQRQELVAPADPTGDPTPVGERVEV
jgi:hypothetical protein